MIPARVLTLALLAATAGLAAAQDDAPLELALGPGPAPVRALAETAVVQGNVTGPCALLEAAGGGPQVAVTAVPVGFNVTARVDAAEGCPGERFVAPVTLTVRAGRDAPALTPQPAALRASLGNASASAEVPLQAAYFGLLDVQAATPVQKGRPQEALTFPVTLRSHGNGPTRVVFEVPSSPEGFNVVVPAPIVLASAAEPGATRTEQTVNVMVMTPYRTGYLNEVGSVTLRVSSHHALRPELKGDASMLSFTVGVEGLYVPAAGLAAAAAALAAVAFAARPPARGR